MFKLFQTVKWCSLTFPWVVEEMIGISASAGHLHLCVWCEAFVKHTKEKARKFMIISFPFVVCICFFVFRITYILGERNSIIFVCVKQYAVYRCFKTQNSTDWTWSFLGKTKCLALKFKVIDVNLVFCSLFFLFFWLQSLRGEIEFLVPLR